MKIYLAIFYLFNLSIMAQSNSKGPDSPVVFGKIISSQSNTIVVEQAGTPRKLSISEKSKIRYVSFEAIKQEFKHGYFIKARVKDNIIDTIYVTLPIVNTPDAVTPEMVQMSVDELFKLTDTDGNKVISYLELSAKIYHSQKHGPDSFYNSDLDASGNLSFAEFGTKLEKVQWYRYSRKSSQEWMRILDSDKSGKLSPPEFAVLVGEGHLDALFKRTDKDNSKSIELLELTDHINKSVFSKPTE
jgi:Ca2+-binding EF-hand superfamily protein